jgi:hypothetical protein
MSGQPVVNPHDFFFQKLSFFIKNRKTPNILFHGPAGSGKRAIVNNFINTLYKNNQNVIQKFVMNVDCSYGKGIKFIREELKFFAKIQIRITDELLFKSVVLLNANNLTVDAQSALRRCIEQFSHTTRFFMIVDDRCQILKPILSRFCEIYIPEPYLQHLSIKLDAPTSNANDKVDCMHLRIEQPFDNALLQKTHLQRVKRYLSKYLMQSDVCSIHNVQLHAVNMYERGYSGIDLLTILEDPFPFFQIPLYKKYKLLIMFNKVRKEIRHEPLFIAFVLHFILIQPTSASLNSSCLL